jgi:voltage-gated potassium channel
MESFREKIKIIIFGTHTPAGKLFDLILIVSILLSVLLVMLDSIVELSEKYGVLFKSAEFIFTGLFTLEYFLRMFSVRKPRIYVFSFFGVIDLLSIIPTYLSIILPGAEVFSVIRVLRVLRVFRVLKLIQFMGEAEMLKEAMLASRRKIFVYLFFVVNLVVILGSVMYIIEGEKSGFDSIPRSIYWSIVTLTTVGYGDISPQTNLGQTIAAIIMIMGYSIIAVPTGIVTSTLTFTTDPQKNICIVCNDNNQAKTAYFCNNCGAKMVKNK